MNILILSWRGPGHPNAGGAEISTHEHAKRWVKSGYSVTLLTSSYKGAKNQEWIDGVNIIRKGNQFFGIHLEGVKWYLFGKHPKFDLVVDQFHAIPFFTPLWVKIKKLGFIHEVTKEVWNLNQFSFPLNFFVATLGNILEPLVFKLYKGIPFMTVSESTKNDLIAWGIPKNNITVIYNGLHISKVKYYPKEKKKTLIFLGALSKDKGIEDVLKIFSILGRSDYNFQFWVVGKGEAHYLKKLEFQSKKLGIDKKVKFWGFVNEEKKFELLSRSHILINTSIREGWGLVVIEAASMGTPTIGYNVPGLRDSIVNGKTGILCSNNTPHDLADNILKLLNDSEGYEKMSRSAKSFSSNFSWEKSSRESLKLIESLASLK